MGLNDFFAKLETIEPRPTEIIVLSVKFDSLYLDDLQVMFKIVQEKFPNNEVICIPDEINLESWDKDALENHISALSEFLEEL